jgi:signal peptidase I
MSGTEPPLQFSLTGEPIFSPQQEPRPAERRPRRLLAGLLSAVVPGLGQIYFGRYRFGIGLFIAQAALISCFWPARLLRFYWGFVLLYLCWIGLYLYATCDALRLPDRVTSKKLSRWWFALALPFAFLSCSFAGALFTRASGFRSFSIPSTSMEKTIDQGDRIVVDAFSYHRFPPARGDVIVFVRNGTYYIKRVIAIGGDSILGTDGSISVNGQVLDEPYVQHRGDAPIWMNNFGPVKVAVGSLFVLGDNRDISLDSRSPDFGTVPIKSVLGKALYVFGSDRPGKSIH